MALSWKIDDVSRIGECIPVEYKHPAWPHFLPRTCGFVSLEVRGEGVLELERDTTAHDADAVDGIDECLRIRLEDIPGPEFDSSPSALNNTSHA